MEPYTLSGQDPGQDGGLLSILQQIQQQNAAPLVPNNPAAQIGSILGGMGAGLLGRPDPVMAMFAANRQANLSNLAQQAGILHQIQSASLQRAQMALNQKAEERRAEHEQRMEEQAGVTAKLTIAKGLMDMEEPRAVAKGLSLFNNVAGLGLSELDMAEMANSRTGKDFPARLSLAINAIKAGQDPAAMGVRLPPQTLQALSQMKPEQLDALLGPDAQAKAADLLGKQLEAKIKAVELGNLEAGLPKGGITKVEDYISNLAARYYANPDMPLTPFQRSAIDQYMLQQKMKGVTSKPELALMAARGDKDAKRALDLLGPDDKALTNVTLALKAAEIEVKARNTPGYVPTLEEKAIVLAADKFAEQKDGKPMPAPVTTKFENAQEVMGTLKTIDDLLKTGKAQQFIGPWAGPIGTAAEKLGFHDPDRSALQQALSGLMASVGPQRFGSAFTGHEEQILKGLLTEVSNPSGQFEVKFNAFKNMMLTKYKGMLGQARANKYHLADEYTSTPFDAPATSGDPRAAKIRQLMSEGKSDAEIEAYFRLRGQ